MEYAVKAQRPLITLFFLLCTGLPAWGQEAGTGVPAYTAPSAAPAPADHQQPNDADQPSGKIAASFGEYLMIFESRRDADDKRLGIPLTPFANSPIHLAYDPTSHQMMAQWAFGSLGLIGHKLQYQAYTDATGTLSFVFSARF
jgi:hypothetical protein